MIQTASSQDGFRSLFAQDGDDDRNAARFDSGRRLRARQERRADSRPGTGGSDRKVHQLCRQVARTLDEVFAECGDRVLQSLRVDNVEPLPNASRLLVTVAFVDNQPGTLADVTLVLEHLHRAGAHLRREIMTSVTRKRAPLLLYRVAEPSNAREVEC